MWIMADMFAQCYRFTDKFTLKFLIGAETPINMPNEEGYREGEGDRGSGKICHSKDRREV